MRIQDTITEYSKGKEQLMMKLQTVEHQMKVLTGERQKILIEIVRIEGSLEALSRVINEATNNPEEAPAVVQEEPKVSP